MKIDAKARILAFDVATCTGWAFFDTTSHESAIQMGVIDLKVSVSDADDVKTAMAKRRVMRSALHDALIPLVEKYQPTVVCIEQPLNYIKAQGGKKPKRLPMFRGDPTPEPTKEKGGPNASTVLALNQLFAVVDEFFYERGVYQMEVAPTSWQTLTKHFPGDTKQRSIAYCSMLNMTIPFNDKKRQGDACDAACIAIWAAGNCQTLKMEQMAAQGEISFSGAAA